MRLILLLAGTTLALMCPKDDVYRVACETVVTTYEQAHCVQQDKACLAKIKKDRDRIYGDCAKTQGYLRYCEPDIKQLLEAKCIQVCQVPQGLKTLLHGLRERIATKLNPCASKCAKVSCVCNEGDTEF